MRKLKRILSLVLTMCIFIGMGSDIKAQAQTIEEVAKLEIKMFHIVIKILKSVPEGHKILIS